MGWHMIQFLFPTVAVLAFAPALLLLYYSLSGYTWPKSQTVYFDDRWIFGFVAVGIIVGAGIFFVELIFSSLGFIYAILFTVVEELIVVTILNFPRMRRKGSGRFYGFALGTAIAAGLAMGEYAELFTHSGYDLPGMAVLAVYSIGLELMGGSTGCVIGRAVEQEKLPYGILIAVAFQSLFVFINIPVLSFSPSLLTVMFATAGIAISLLFYSHVVRRVLPQPSASAPGKRKRYI
jgi:hypothetical protein